MYLEEERAYIGVIDPFSGDVFVYKPWYATDDPIDLNIPPRADFDFLCLRLDCTFTDNSSDSDGTVVDWTWDFGDGSTAQTQDADHSYTSAGAYTVTLSVTDDGGATTSATAEVTVVVPNPSPVADFDFSCTALTCAFTDQSVGGDGSLVAWTWDFGDGNASTVQDPIHAYTEPGSYLVALSVTNDAGETAMVTATLTVGTSLLEEDFASGSLAGWRIVDEGAANAPSAWSANSAVLVQNSNIHGGDPTNAASLPKPGSFAVYEGGNGWSDYSTTLALSSDDDDAIGLMFRMQDADNYYRFSWDKQRSYRRLVKKVGGVFTLLAEDALPYAQGQTYQVEILAAGDLIEVRIDGALIFSVTDADLTQGTIATYAWGNVGARFDDIRITDLASGNRAPLIASVSAAPANILDTDSSQLTVVADDPDDAPNAALTYQWTVNPADGSLDDASSASPIFTPPDVSAPTSYTLTVAVTDGEATVSDSVVVTVNDADAPPALLQEDFSHGTLSGWTVIDEGTVNAPSAWSAASGTLVQSSNIHGGSTSGSLLPKPVPTPSTTAVMAGATTVPASP